jgi:hypothetical protein
MLPNGDIISNIYSFGNIQITADEKKTCIRKKIVLSGLRNQNHGLFYLLGRYYAFNYETIAVENYLK